MALNGVGAYSPYGSYPVPGAAAPAANLGAAGTGGIPGQSPSLNQALGLNTPPGGNQQLLVQMMQMMLQMLQMVMSLLGGQNSGPQFSRALPGDAGNAGNAGNAGGAALAAAPVGFGTGPINPTANAENDPQLQQSLAAIAQDPEGRRLLEMAQRNGVRISSGDPGGPNVLGVFIQRGNDREIIVRDPSNLKTIVHELVHASTIEDGNSQHEEGIANIIGDRVASRITGRQSGNANQIYNQTLPLYQDLGRFNSIEQSLGRLGIVA